MSKPTRTPPPDDDVVLDLQSALDACFDLVGYEVLLDYQANPSAGGLSAEEQQWAMTQLERAGLHNQQNGSA